jgi:hypothetical protein
MSVLTSPAINVVFTEAGISAISRGEKGVVAVIVRDAAGIAPVSITQQSQIPSALGVETQAYVRRTFLGYINPPKRVILYTIGNEGALSDALDYLATQDFDWLAGPADCSQEDSEAIAGWIAEQREESGAKYKAVLPNYAGDSEAIVNFAASGMTDGVTTYTAAAYCSRIAGLLAGTPFSISATYAPLTELSDVSRLDKEARDDSVGKGELILRWDGEKVKVDRAVTSLTTTTEDRGDSFKKIKLVEVMDLIRTDITKTAEDSYIGKYANTYDNKLLLVTAVRTYFQGLCSSGLIDDDYTVDIDVAAQESYLQGQGTDTSEMDEKSIREASTGSHAFLRVSCHLVDAIEDINLAIAI